MRPYRLIGLIAVLLFSVAGAAAAADDDTTSMRWLEARTAAGDVPATTELATRLELGVGINPDPARAMALFCRAARFGSRVAIMHIAAWLLTDEAPDYDPDLAAAWLHRAQRAERNMPVNATAKVPRCPSDAAAPLTASTTALSGIIEQIAFEQGVDSHLVKAIITEESGFQSNAISSAGAVGLMQLMPATAQHYGAQDRFDIGQNLRAGIAYLGDMLRRYNGSVPLALAAYGMGPAEVDRCQCVPAVPVILTYIERVQALQAARPPATGRLTAVNTTTPHRSAKP